MRHSRTIILAVILFAGVCATGWAQAPGAKDWRPVGTGGEWNYFVDWSRITNDNFYSRFWMLGVHKVTGQEVEFEVECKKSKRQYRTIGAGQVSVTSNSYVNIPAGSVIEGVFEQVKDLRRGSK